MNNDLKYEECGIRTKMSDPGLWFIEAGILKYEGKNTSSNGHMIDFSENNYKICIEV